MQLLARSLLIDDKLTAADIDVQANQLGRYHLIKDLVLKGPGQIACFLERVERIASDSGGIQLSLITVLFRGEACSGFAKDLPLFDFIGIRTTACDAYGVMFSTYLHDLDREAIRLERLPCACSTASRITRLLMDSLYLPTRFNDGRPPFPDQKPLFIFPPSKPLPQHVSTSATDRYMARLGYRVASLKTRQSEMNLRIFCHQAEEIAFEPASINPSILAVGQACVEMSKDTTPLPEGCLKPFDRSRFNLDVQNRQTRIAQQWLKANLMSLRDESLACQTGPLCQMCVVQ